MLHQYDINTTYIQVAIKGKIMKKLLLAAMNAGEWEKQEEKTIVLAVILIGLINLCIVIAILNM
jgi:hypothetical protein